jgi:pantoate--beta-alanine ligase
MQVIRSIEQMKDFVRQARSAGKTLGLVPTMGALHQGHLSLIRKAKRQCGATVVSIFLNPTQFGPSEDLNRYPKNLEQDIEMLRPFNVSAAFTPTLAEMYPAGSSTTVDPGLVAARLEGLSRPQHFRGVATVVLKLFNIVTPDVAYFGQKDFQQAAMVRQLVRDFNLDVRLVTCPIVRDADGVAVSSRNVYLQPEEREAAKLLSLSLKRARELVWGGEVRAEIVIGEMRRLLESDPQVRLDYTAIVDRDSLNPVERITIGSVALVAANIGSARLIDNTIFGPLDATEEQLLEMSQPAGRPAGSVRPPGLEAESLRLKIQDCRECAAISTVIMPPREFLMRHLKTSYPDLGAIRVLLIGRDAPWNPENYLYRRSESADRFVTRIYELLGVKDFSEFRSEYALTDALRCHSIISPVSERALANCARHLREELRLFPALQAIIILGEDAYNQFQRFVLGRAAAEITPWRERLSERGWAVEEVRLDGLERGPVRVFYCYHPVAGYEGSPSIARELAGGDQRAMIPSPHS